MGKITLPILSQMLLKASRSRLTRPEKSWTELLGIRGPGNSAFLVEMHQSKDVCQVRFLLKNFILGKHRCKYEESGITEFEKNGYIMTKPLRHYNECLKKAVLDANHIGAEKLIPVRETRQLKFVCQPDKIELATKKLSNFGYEIDSTGVTYFPLHMVALAKRDLITCENFLRIMETLPNVVKIYDNIYR